MRPPTFLQGVGVALVLALSGAALFAAVAPLVSGAGLLRLLVAGLASAYVIYLLAASRVRTGRFATFVLWLVAVTAMTYLAPSLPLYLIAHALLIWLVRSVFFRRGLLPALLDGALSVVALAAAVWVATGTGSLFLGLWCFFLVQALFVAIPDRLGAHAARRPSAATDDAFDRAYRTAEAAVRRLSSESR
jgi:hypothetical protein